MIQFDIEKLTNMYLDFLEKERTEYEKATEATDAVAEKLSLNEFAREKIYNNIVDVVRASLKEEVEFWNKIVTITEDEPVEQSTESEMVMESTATVSIPQIENII